MKYGVEVVVPSLGSRPAFKALPDASLRKVQLWQVGAGGEADLLVMEAAYGRCAAAD